MKAILKDISSIQTGLFAKSVAKGEVVYLQSKHFGADGQLQANLFPDLLAEGISKKHLLQAGDVLFAAKGTKNFATVFENFNQPAVASTSFFVIRIFYKNILPKFLAWFLNSPTAQTYLKLNALGTSMVSISIDVLEGMEIPIPTLEIQRKILEIITLHNKVKSLKQKIETLREKQIQQQILKSINI